MVLRELDSQGPNEQVIHNNAFNHLNSFATRFALIDAAVAAKQDFATREVKTLFRVPGDKITMAQIATHTDKVFADLEKQHDALVAVVRAA